MFARARAERAGGGYASVDDAIEQRREEDGLLHTPRVLLEEEMAEHLVADEDGRYRYRYSREAAAAAFEQAASQETRFAEVLCPTMIVRARDVSWLSERDVDVAFEQIRRLRVEEVPGGRAVLWDSLAETSALVRDFLVAKRKTA
jgi:hypothetical protein